MRRTLFAVHSKRVSARIHGGLTPAALVNVRLFIAKIVIFPADARCTGDQERMACASRGERIESADGIRMCAGRVHERSDVPVELAAGIRIIRPALAFPTRSGGRKPPVEHTPHTSSQRRNSAHCTCRYGSENHGGLTPAALENVRLCTAKIVFCRQAFATQYKRGRRKPTVANQRYCTGVSNSHAGLTLVALVNVRLCSANVIFHCERTSCNQERGA